MSQTKKAFGLVSIVALTCSLGLLGCGDDESDGNNTGGTGTGASGGNGGSGNTGGGTGGTGTGAMGGMGGMGGEAPAETPVDRMGRPAINTALTDRFSAGHDAAAEAYNVNHDDTTWDAMYAADFAASIAIYDAIDTVCMNQAFSCDDETDAACYGVFAGVLADDKLWLDTDYTTCVTYLGVEADATGLLANDDCGGRRPVDDVIQRTYSLLVNGSLADIDDGIAVEPETLAADGTFPYLGAPNN